MQGERTFGRRVKELRKAKNLSQRELAERVASRLRAEDGKGFDFTYLSKVENDKSAPPSSPVILQLAAELEADSDELLALANKPPSDLGKTLSGSEAARTFYRSAVNSDLSEEHWQELLETLRRMKGDSDR
jgi:HTH-type transcriptional regulator, competence development regulator